VQDLALAILAYVRAEPIRAELPSIDDFQTVSVMDA
jgi:hypothetical protein